MVRVYCVTFVLQSQETLSVLGFPNSKPSPPFSQFYEEVEWEFLFHLLAFSNKENFLSEECLILTPRIHISAHINEKSSANALFSIHRQTHYHHLTWAWDEVKRPKLPPARSQGPEGPLNFLSVIIYERRREDLDWLIEEQKFFIVSPFSFFVQLSSFLLFFFYFLLALLPLWLQ